MSQAIKHAADTRSARYATDTRGSTKIATIAPIEAITGKTEARTPSQPGCWTICVVAS